MQRLEETRERLKKFRIRAGDADPLIRTLWPREVGTEGRDLIFNVEWMCWWQNKKNISSYGFGWSAWRFTLFEPRSRIG